jgi:hypothetical protein
MVQAALVSELNSNYQSAKKDYNPRFLVANSGMHLG